MSKPISDHLKIEEVYVYSLNTLLFVATVLYIYFDNQTAATILF